MTSLTVERFTTPSTAHERRELAWLRAWASEELAGRTVWCAAARGGPGRRAADALRDGLHRPAADAVDVAAPEPLRGATERVEAALAGARHAGMVDRDDELACLEGTLDGERLADARIAPGDVVVVHDALSALLTEALRARGAHVIWHEHLPAGSSRAVQRAARDLVLRCAGRCDAHLVTWVDTEPSGPAEHLAAALPRTGHVEAKAVAGAARDDDLRATAWSVALADVVSTDREEHVGGALHARPAVPAR